MSTHFFTLIGRLFVHQFQPALAPVRRVALLALLLVAGFATFGTVAHAGGEYQVGSLPPRLEIRAYPITVISYKGIFEHPSVEEIFFRNSGNGPLRWQMVSASALGTGCQANPFKWLSVDSAYGLLKPGQSTTVKVTIAPADMAVGTHQATICLLSNDPYTPQVTIPVTVIVKASE